MDEFLFKKEKKETRFVYLTCPHCGLNNPLSAVHFLDISAGEERRYSIHCSRCSNLIKFKKIGKIQGFQYETN